jgi:hypothetical protein
VRNRAPHRGTYPNGKTPGIPTYCDIDYDIFVDAVPVRFENNS